MCVKEEDCCRVRTKPGKGSASDRPRPVVASAQTPEMAQQPRMSGVDSSVYARAATGPDSKVFRRTGRSPNGFRRVRRRLQAQTASDKRRLGARTRTDGGRSLNGDATTAVTPPAGGKLSLRCCYLKADRNSEALLQ